MTPQTTPPGQPAAAPGAPAAPYPAPGPQFAPPPPPAGQGLAFGQPQPPFGQPQPFGQPPAPERSGRRTGTIIGAIVAAVLVLGGLAVAAVLLFGNSTLDTTAVEDEIVAVTERESGVAPTEVECPGDVTAEAGATFTCTAVLDGQPLSYTISQTDDEGNVRIESDTIFVVVSDVEGIVNEQVGAEAGVEVTTECDADGRSVVVDPAGTTVPCTVTNAGDPTDTLDVIATLDEEGNVTWEAA